MVANMDSVGTFEMAVAMHDHKAMVVRPTARAHSKCAFSWTRCVARDAGDPQALLFG